MICNTVKYIFQPRVWLGLNIDNNEWSDIEPLKDYRESISYDPNGNILTYDRNGSPSIPGKEEKMDELTYIYYASKNQLRQITDNPAFSGYYTEDIDNQANPDNYTYDAIGNSEQIKLHFKTVSNNPMQKVDLEIFIPLLLIKQVESFRDSYSLTKVLSWKFGIISTVDTINRLKELEMVLEYGSGNMQYSINAKGLKYLESNWEEGKKCLVKKYNEEKSFIESLFSPRG